MADYIKSEVYTKLGVHPVINAGGNTTRWGGSTPSPGVKQAMDEADKNWALMEELLEKSGAYIADLLGVEAAYITSGCYAALVLSTAACITGKDPEKRDRIPDTTGMKNEILIQKRQRYGFDRSFTTPGSKLVEVGDEDGCTPEQLARAMGSNTAALAYFVQPDWGSAVVSLEDAVQIAHEHDVPVIADAASQIYPLDYFRRTAQSADLVCFGGKYFNAPQSAGFVCGKKDLIEAVVDHGFIGPRPFGRGMKLDRQEIIGLVAALEAWFSMDHNARFAGYEARGSAIAQQLQGAPNVQETKVVQTGGHSGVFLHVVFDSKALGKNAQQVAGELDVGDPNIRVSGAGDHTLSIDVHTLNEGEEDVVADSVRSVLTNTG